MTMNSTSNLLVEVAPFRPILKESKDASGIFEMEGIMQTAGTKNQNGRVYSRPILEREVQRFMEDFVKNGNAYGELDHPDSPVVSLKNASHIIKKLWWEGSNLMGRIELLDTPAGNIVKAIVKRGHTIGISSRGTGSVEQTNEGTLMVQNDFSLVTWDFVSNPSTVSAFMKPVSLNEAKQVISKMGRIDEIINEILRS